jgi:hypothetical protein
MRQIIALVAVGGHDFAWHPGQVVDLPDEEAAAWADGERARYLEPSDFLLAHQQLTDDEAEQIKERWLAGHGRAPVTVLDEPVRVLLDEQAPTPAYVFRLVDAWASGEPLDFQGHEVPEDVQARIADVVGQKISRTGGPVETTDRPRPAVPTGEPPRRETTTQPAPERTAATPPQRSGPGSGKAAWAAYAAELGVAVPVDAGRDQIIAAVQAAGVEVA